MDAAEIKERRETIAWTAKHKAPHSCGDREDGALCPQNLDGTCPRRSCDYFGLVAAEKK